MKCLFSLAIAFALSALSSLSIAAPTLPAKELPADVGAGRVAWFDIATTDLTKAKAFFGPLFGWSFQPVQGSDQAAEIVAGATAIGTLRVADGKLSPYNGVVYVQVDDLPVSCKKAKELGGTVAPDFPFDLPDGRGAIAVVLDPSGHPVGMYSRASLPAAGAPAK